MIISPGKFHNPCFSCININISVIALWQEYCKIFAVHGNMTNNYSDGNGNTGKITSNQQTQVQLVDLSKHATKGRNYWNP
jgi:hypothetical protein